jgi:hypothetical protein
MGGQSLVRWSLVRWSLVTARRRPARGIWWPWMCAVCTNLLDPSECGIRTAATAMSIDERHRGGTSLTYAIASLEEAAH